MLKPLSKPPQEPAPKPKRFPERKAVTIAAGFKCPGGIVLCADTQETVAGLSKRHVPKLRVEPSGFLLATSALRGYDLAVAFCGSTDNGPFLDEIVETAWKSVQEAESLDDACEKIRVSIKESYREAGEVYQTGYCPSANLIYGVKKGGQSKLFEASGPSVNEKNSYCSAGAGYYMADFLASRMYSHELTIQQCIILAAYVLFEAKEHVDGCGGDSHIAVLRNNGHSGLEDSLKIKSITEMLQSIDTHLGRLVLDSANFDLDEERFAANFNAALKSLAQLRTGTKVAFEYWDMVRQALIEGTPPTEGKEG